MTQQFLTWTGFHTIKTALLVGLSLASLVSVGCGESGMQTVSPVGPSLLSSASREGTSSVVADHDRIGGLHTFGSTDDDEDSDVDNDEDSDEHDHREVEIGGTIGTATTGCPIGSFTVRTGTRELTVRTSALTRFRHGFCDDLRLAGTRVEVHGSRALDGSLDATRIEFQEAEHEAEAEIEGVIRTATTGCPVGSFTVRAGSRDMVVRTSAPTMFRQGTCNDLQTVGAGVEVKGQRALDGSIDATYIEFESAEHEPEAEIAGVIRTASSACPTGSFTVRAGRRDVVVRMSSLTMFRHGTCHDLRTVGTRVEVKGRRVLDGSIDATRIEFEESDDEDSDD